MPPVTAMYSGPTFYPRSNQPVSSDAAVKSVHFNTVHNCQQLAAVRAPRGSPLLNVDEDLEGPGLATTSLTSAGIGQSLPASYRCRNATAESPQPMAVQAQPSTPTATINRHYAVQPRTLYRPGLESQPATTVSGGAVSGCPMSTANGPHLSLSPQCTMSDSGCVSPPTTRLRHYCV